MQDKFLIVGPADATTTILLAHGAGAPMDSSSMNAATAALADVELRVARFEFDYMAARRTATSRKPSPKAEKLIPEYQTAIAALAAHGPLIIGGKSMGGRVASMIAGELFASNTVVGLLCLGYPFHPPGKPDQLRTTHLETLSCPTLICQGTRDEFGTRSDVATYALSDCIDLLWLEDGDHDLKPRKTISGYSTSDHLATMALAVKAWAATLGTKAG